MSYIWHIPIAVYTVLDSWWWTEELSETFRVLFQKWTWEITAFSWCYYKNISWYTVLWMSNFATSCQLRLRTNPRRLDSLTLKFLGRYGWSCCCCCCCCCCYFMLFFAFWPSWGTPIGSYKSSVITPELPATVSRPKLSHVPCAFYCFSHVLATLLYNSR